MSKSLQCLDCGKSKPLTEMCKHAGMKHGYERLCKSCRSNRRYKNGEYLRERIRKHVIRSGKPVNYKGNRINELMEAKNCSYCGVEMNHIKEDKHQLTIDHIFPNINIDDNLVVCCRSCNSTKNKKHIYDFYKTSDKFTDELWIAFVKDFAQRILKQEPTPEEVEAFSIGFADESAEMKAVSQE